jgi:hypothetical protein
MVPELRVVVPAAAPMARETVAAPKALTVVALVLKTVAVAEVVVRVPLLMLAVPATVRALAPALLTFSVPDVARSPEVSTVSWLELPTPIRQVAVQPEAAEVLPTATSPVPLPWIVTKPTVPVEVLAPPWMTTLPPLLAALPPAAAPYRLSAPPALPVVVVVPAPPSIVRLAPTVPAVALPVPWIAKLLGAVAVPAVELALPKKSSLLVSKVSLTTELVSTWRPWLVVVPRIPMEVKALPPCRKAESVAVERQVDTWLEVLLHR